ncbi:MAG: putative membrane protein [Polyangiales bacterium]
MTPKRLHPAHIFLAAASYLRRLLVLVGLLLFQVGREQSATTLVGVLAGVVLLVLSAAFVSWWRFRFAIEGSHFVITSGVISLKRREIPLAKIQDLAFERNALHRMLGLVSVSLQTSGTAGAEAALSAVSLDDAEELKRLLLGQGAEQDPSDTSAPLAEPIIRLHTRDLLLRGLTDNRAGLLIAGTLGFFHEALEAQADLVKGLILSAAAQFDDAGALRGTTLIAIALIVVWLLGYVASSAFNLIVFYGFELREREGTFHRRFGLITLKSHSLPRGRIQALTIHQPLMRRLLGIASMEVRDMGGGQDQKEAKRVGSDTFVPAGSLSALLDVRTQVFPDAPTPTWRRASTRLIRRSVTGGFLLTSPLLVVAYLEQLPAVALLPLLGAALGGILGWRRHRVLAYDFSSNYFALRDGVFGRAWTDVPLQRIEAVRLDRSPLDRWHGVATLRIVVGGGGVFSVPNVELGAAELLRDQLEQALPTPRNAVVEHGGVRSPSVAVPI